MKLGGAEKSHHLLSASWRPGEADRVIPVQRPGNRGADGVSPVPGQEKTNGPAQADKREGKTSSLPLPLFLFWPSAD